MSKVIAVPVLVRPYPVQAYPSAVAVQTFANYSDKI